MPNLSGAAPFGFKLGPATLQGIRTKMMAPDPATANIAKLTALNVELAQVEDEIEKLLNALTGANAVLLSYANGKIEELDADQQRFIKEIAAMNAGTISPQKIEFLSAHLDNWENIDFDDRRQVTDIILSQIQATSDRVSFEWKI